MQVHGKLLLQPQKILIPLLHQPYHRRHLLKIEVFQILQKWINPLLLLHLMLQVQNQAIAQVKIIRCGQQRWAMKTILNLLRQR